MIKGIIYDLDGTIISTTKFHEKAWIEAGKIFNINIPRDFLINQRGMTNEAATKMLIPNDEEKLKSFVKAKEEYVIENAGKVDLFKGFKKTCEYLLSKSIKVWVCTSAPKEFVEKVYRGIPFLSKLEDKTVWREMYKNGKPDAEPILLTLNKMNLLTEEAIYVGDAYSDYLSSTNADCNFVYFCPDDNNKDNRVPKSTPIITSHKELTKFLIV